MSFRDILEQQKEGARALSSPAGVIGLHLVSGPLVGFAMGYALDRWLGTTPWCGLAGLLLGIVAGFLNVWRDSRQLISRLEQKPSGSQK